MRIVSQNRQVSVEFGNGMIKIDGPYIFFNTEQGEEILGLYKTPERVREVFEDIHKAYSPTLIINGGNIGKDAPTPDKWWDGKPGFVLCANNNSHTSFQTIDNFVYYMPEE